MRKNNAPGLPRKTPKIPPRPEAEAAGTPVAQLSGIMREYLQGTESIAVLKGISLTFYAGDFAAIVGSSGAGKSTLLHIIGLLDRPTGGRYLLGGNDTGTLDDDALSVLRGDGIGFVFQNFYLLPHATALENVLLPGTYSLKPKKELHERARHLLERVGLADRMDHTPARLSGGQQQRVAIARALLNEPFFILADEPTGQLDSGTSAAILELLASLNEAGTTIVIVTHDPVTAKAAKRAIQLHDGRVVDDARAV